MTDFFDGLDEDDFLPTNNKPTMNKAKSSMPKLGGITAKKDDDNEFNWDNPPVSS